MNGKLHQRTREHRPTEEPTVPRTEDKSLSTFPQTTSITVFGQVFIKQPVTPLTRVESNPVTPTIPMEIP